MNEPTNNFTPSGAGLTISRGKQVAKKPREGSFNESVCYLPIALETDDGWCAALAEYDATDLRELQAVYGNELPSGSEVRIVASCGHRHRTMEACAKCFPRMERKKKFFSDNVRAERPAGER